MGYVLVAGAVALFGTVGSWQCGERLIQRSRARGEDER